MPHLPLPPELSVVLPFSRCSSGVNNWYSLQMLAFEYFQFFLTNCSYCTGPQAGTHAYLILVTNSRLWRKPTLKEVKCDLYLIIIKVLNKTSKCKWNCVLAPLRTDRMKLPSLCQEAGNMVLLQSEKRTLASAPRALSTCLMSELPSVHPAYHRMPRYNWVCVITIRCIKWREWLYNLIRQSKQNLPHPYSVSS